MKDYSRDLDEIRMSRDELLIHARESEKKAKHFETDLMQAQEDLCASERQRRAAEMERDELQDELSGGLKDRWEMFHCSTYGLFDDNSNNNTFA